MDWLEFHCVKLQDGHPHLTAWRDIISFALSGKKPLEKEESLSMEKKKALPYAGMSRFEARGMDRRAREARESLIRNYAALQHASSSTKPNPMRRRYPNLPCPFAATPNRLRALTQRTEYASIKLDGLRVLVLMGMSDGRGGSFVALCTRESLADPYILHIPAKDQETSQGSPWALPPKVDYDKLTVLDAELCFPRMTDASDDDDAKKRNPIFFVFDALVMAGASLISGVRWLDRRRVLENLFGGQDANHILQFGESLSFVCKPFWKLQDALAGGIVGCGSEYRCPLTGHSFAVDADSAILNDALFASYFTQSDPLACVKIKLSQQSDVQTDRFQVRLALKYLNDDPRYSSAEIDSWYLSKKTQERVMFAKVMATRDQLEYMLAAPELKARNEFVIQCLFVGGTWCLEDVRPDKKVPNFEDTLKDNQECVTHAQQHPEWTTRDYLALAMPPTAAAEHPTPAQ